MVPWSYLEFMITSAGAAGAMIGLFSSLSRCDRTWSLATTLPKVKTLAASSFTGLVNAFSLAMLAIVPATNIGVGMVVLAVICLYSTLELHVKALRRRPVSRAHAHHAQLRRAVRGRGPLIVDRTRRGS